MRVALLCVLLSGCASVQDAADQTMPRLGATLEAAKAVYAAACTSPPKGAEGLCEDVRIELNRAISVYGDARESLGGE